nr:hypothetical protein [Streptomyces sp. IMTB 2501]
MPSVVGLLEQRELAARRRVDELREEAHRIQADLAVADRDRKEWAIACSRVGEVLAPVDEIDQGDYRPDQAVSPTGRPAGQTQQVPEAAQPKSQVPVWREGLAWSALSVDYQCILRALADRVRLGQGSATCQETAAGFGMEVVRARVVAPRAKAKRLVARGWLGDPAPGRFTLAAGVSGPAAFCIGQVRRMPTLSLGPVGRSAAPNRKPACDRHRSSPERQQLLTRWCLAGRGRRRAPWQPSRSDRRAA